MSRHPVREEDPAITPRRTRFLFSRFYSGADVSDTGACPRLANALASILPRDVARGRYDRLKQKHFDGRGGKFR